MRSGCAPSTLAVSVIGPATVGVTTIVIVVEVPGAMVVMVAEATPAVFVTVTPLTLLVPETKVAVVGNTSSTTMPEAVAVESLFVMVNVYVSFEPTVPVVGEPVFVIERSIAPVVPAAWTGVTRVATLFVWFVSTSVASPLAVSTIAPGAVGVTTIVIVAETPAAKVGMVAVATPAVFVTVTPATLLVPETKVAPGGNTSATTTPVAPVVVLLFVTVRV